MAQQFSALSDKHVGLIEEQKIFFVATAVGAGRINLSPKGMDSFVVLGPNRVAWLNVTGSGNETAAHVQVDPRMTIMFCSFTEQPMILRLYGTAKAVHRGDPEWSGLYSSFKPLPGARQIFDVAVDLVQTSCGMAVPYFDYVGERESLNDWALAKGEEGIRQYWETKNRHSIDGIPTQVVEKSG